MSANEPGGSSSGGFRLHGAMLSDVGCVRALNEDAVAFVTPPSDRTTADMDALLMVADGMGGHAAGEIASAMAAEVVRRVFFRLEGSPPDLLRAAFMAANEAILEYGQLHPESSGLGTTCTALAVRGDKAWLGHVGDSRFYLWRGGVLTQHSEDQSLVAKMVREGMLTPEEAKTSVHSNIILQALGAKAELEPDVWNEGLALAPGDSLILSTDGLHGLVPEENIAEIVGRLPPMAACEALIQSALDAGGYDNISVGVFRVDEATPASARAEKNETREIPVFDDGADAAEDPSRVTRRLPSFARQP